MGIRSLKPVAAFVLLALLRPAGGDSGDAAYRASIEKWRQQREARLKADDGWLTVAGLFWLKEGPNRCGADPSSQIALPAGSAPAKVGVFEHNRGKTTFQAEPGAAVTIDGKPVTRADLRDDAAGSPTLVAVGDLTLHVIKRGDRYGVRLKDKNSKFRREFAGLAWYRVDPVFRIKGRFVRYQTPKTLTITSILGDQETMTNPGYAVFTLNGREHRLEPVTSGNQLFFIFRDQTAGKGTYPAGRFLYADQPTGEEIVLDFNKAYNPPCAFNPYTTCPLPPRQNRLAAPIPAGERYRPPKT